MGGGYPWPMVQQEAKKKSTGRSKGKKNVLTKSTYYALREGTWGASDFGVGKKAVNSKNTRNTGESSNGGRSLGGSYGKASLGGRPWGGEKKK